MGIFNKDHLSSIQRWALSYLIVERKRTKTEDQNEYWKNQLFISNKPLYDQIYNPNASESGVINEEIRSRDLDLGYDNSDEIEQILGEIYGESYIQESKLADRERV